MRTLKITWEMVLARVTALYVTEAECKQIVKQLAERPVAMN